MQVSILNAARAGILGAVGLFATLASQPAAAQGSPASEQPCSRLWGADRPCRPDYAAPWPRDGAARRQSEQQQQQPATQSGAPRGN